MKLKFDWLNNFGPLSDENVLQRVSDLKTSEQFFDFVEKAKELKSENASNAIGWLFANPGFIGKNRYSPTRMGPEEFASDPDLYDKMTTTAIDALKVLPKASNHLAKILSREDRYYSELRHIAGRRGVSLPKLKTHEDEVIAALLERGRGGDTLAFHELGYNVGSNYPEKVANALAGLDSEYVVLGFYEVAFASCRSHTGINDNKVYALGGLLTVFDKHEAGEYKNINPKKLRDVIDGVCKAMLDTKSILADLKNNHPDNLLNDSDESVEKIRNMFACVDKRLGHEDMKYTQMFDFTVELHDRILAEKQEIVDLYKDTFPEQELA